jgi:competence protein ComFB
MNEDSPESPPELTIYDLQHELCNENQIEIFAWVARFQQEKRLPCSCRECLLDITAVALNYLPPHYSVSIHTDLYRDAQQLVGRQIEIEAAVLYACEKVKHRPHHD